MKRMTAVLLAAFFLSVPLSAIADQESFAIVQAPVNVYDRRV